MRAALAYHQATEHTPDRLRRAARSLDWANRPLPFKAYRHLEPIPLPVELPESGAAAVEVLSGAVRREPAPLDLGQVARLLFYSAGVTRRMGGGSSTVFFRAAPSAGALFPIELYAAGADLAGLAAGLYHFGPIDFSLRRLRDGDWRGWLAEAAADPSLAEAPLLLVLSGIPWRTTWKYGERGYRHLFWDAGVILANLLAAAEAVRLPVRLRVAFVDRAVAELLGLDLVEEMPLVLAAVGPAGEPAPPRDPPELLDLEVVPLSPRPLRHPLLEETHRSGEQHGHTEVEEWRRAAAGLGPEQTVEGVEAPPGTDTIEEVILRRGSTRRFAREAIPSPILSWCLAVAGRAVPGDWVAPGRSLVERLLAVHAVEGLEPGAYRWSSEGLQLLHRHVTREASAYLCLGQTLGGDAATTVFLSAPLQQVLGHLGDRGYRAAQLEAGIVSGRLHLGAYAAGLGATGLTFFDNEVAALFATGSQPMLVTALGVPAYRARPGRPPSEVPPLRLVHGN